MSKSLKPPTLIGIAQVVVGVVMGVGIGLSILVAARTGQETADAVGGSGPTAERGRKIDVSTGGRTGMVASGDFDAAWRDAASAGSPTEQSLWEVAARWIEVDPVAVTTAILADGRVPLGWAMELVHRWTAEDPQGALNWLFDEPRSGQMVRLIGAALQTVVATDPGLAMLYAGRLEGAARQRAYDTVLRRWAERDARGVAVWLESRPELDVPSHNLFDVAKRYGEQDPDEALRWARRSPLGSPKMVGEVVQGAAGRSLSTAEGLINFRLGCFG